MILVLPQNSQVRRWLNGVATNSPHSQTTVLSARCFQSVCILADRSSWHPYELFTLTVLLRNLPRHYTYNNIYGLFPFTLPTTTRKDLTDAQLSHLYDMERPVIRKTMTLNTRTAIQHVLNNPTTFPTSYGRDLKFLTNGYGCVGYYA